MNPFETPFTIKHLEGKELEVPAGEYRDFSGNESPIRFNPEKLLLRPGLEDLTYWLPGTRFRGFYILENLSSRMVFSFLYHKSDVTGALETTERAVVGHGFGYGEHPGHPGQRASWYIVGSQIGTIERTTGDFATLEQAGVEIAHKHFSIACITDGPLGEAILANPQQSEAQLPL